MRVSALQTGGNKGRPFVFVICGYKNSGKTTMITRLVPLLVRKGYRVAVIKHDGHDFVGDVPGTDSFRHMESGAYGTAVFSRGHYMVNKKGTDVTEQELIGMFPEADIVLIEGLKDSDYPRYVCNFPENTPVQSDVEALAEEIGKLYLEHLDSLSLI